LVIGGVVLVVYAMRGGSTMSTVSSFIKMGKNARLSKSKVNRNKSAADSFVEMGDDSSIEETDIEDNEHTPPNVS
jgi:hypothetical protein